MKKEKIEEEIKKTKQLLKELEEKKQKKCNHQYLEVARQIDIWWGWAEFRCPLCGHSYIESY